MAHDVKLGQLQQEGQQRDAVHIAVAPVVAGEQLYPGDHIGFTGTDGETVGGHVDAAKCLGIVDPYLKRRVQPGDRFFMFLYPATITSLRHDWTHPAFTDAPIVKGRSKAESEAWLRRFCETSDCPGYETVVAAALNHPEGWNDEYLHFDGRDAHGEIPPEFWDHIEVVTGCKVEVDRRAKSFSCSC